MYTWRMESSASSPQELTTQHAAASPSARDRTIAAVSSLLFLIGMPIGWLPGSTGDTVGLIVIGLIVLGLMGGVILWLVPRERAAGRASRTALVLGIAAFLTILVFWTGLPFPLGAGAIALGLSAREATTTGRGEPTAGIILGGFAILAAFVVLLIG
jgi:hypothetical protein